MSEPVTHELRFHRDAVGADGLPLGARPAVRILYVVDGTVTLASPGGGWPERLGANEATLGTAATTVVAVNGHATVLRWELLPAGAEAADGPPSLTGSLSLTDHDGYLVRCDRVDFPPGGVALLHTHQGPGIRCLLRGRLRVETEGGVSTIEPLEPWYERGPEPVFAAASDREDTSFARVMVLPRRLRGQPSIRYVRPEDRDKPKSQRYTVFVDEPIVLPGAA